MRFYPVQRGFPSNSAALKALRHGETITLRNFNVRETMKVKTNFAAKSIDKSVDRRMATCLSLRLATRQKTRCIITKINQLNSAKLRFLHSITIRSYKFLRKCIFNRDTDGSGTG